MENIQSRFSKEDYEIFINAVHNTTIEVNKALVTLSKIAEKMDGKDYNKRMQTAFEKEIGTDVVSFCREDNRISLFPRNRSVQVNGNWIYFEIEICYDVYLKDGKYFNKPNAVGEDGTINAEGFKFATARCIVENIKRMVRRIDAFNNWDVNLKILEDIKSYALEHAKNLNPLFIPTERGNSLLYDLYQVADKQLTERLYKDLTAETLC